MADGITKDEMRQLFEEFIAACSVHSEFAEYTGIKRLYLDSKESGVGGEAS